MINWTLDVDDVACPANDMKTTDSRSFVQRGMAEERDTENGGLGYEFTGISRGDPQPYRRRRLCFKVPRGAAQKIDVPRRQVGMWGVRTGLREL